MACWTTARPPDRTPTQSPPKGRLTTTRAFQSLARDIGFPITGLAYRYILHTVGVTTMLGGFLARGHVEDIVSAAQAGPLPEAVRGRIAIILSE